MLIVPNDNEMSISRSVGGLSTRLNKLRLTRAYQETKEASKRTISRIPVIGEPLFDLLAWAKEGFKRSWAKVGFFEDIGLTYIGVLDGHDLPELEKAFEQALHLRGPVVVHVKTIKGKGYAPAEADSVSFHGASLPPIDLGLIDPTEEPLPVTSGASRAPSTRRTMTCARTTCRCSSPSTGRGSSVRAAPATRACSRSPLSAAFRTWRLARPRMSRSCATWWSPRWRIQER